MQSIRISTWALSLLLLALSLTQWFLATQLWVWKATILSTEFSHYFLLLILVLLGLAAYSDPRVIGILLLAAVGFAQPWMAFSKKSSEIEDFSMKQLFLGSGVQKVAYQTHTFSSDEKLTLDYYPAENPTGAWFLIVHGGGWDSGDSQQLPDLNSVLAREGYAVFSLNYRLAPQFKWPAPSEDIEKAILFISSHAAEWKLDLQKLFVLGRSAGGQIAGAWAYGKPSLVPRAVFLFYCPTDMIFGYEAGDEDDILKSRGLVRDYMGGTPYELTDKYQEASPLFLIKKDGPATILFHGGRDTLVWVKHSQRLTARLEHLGAKVTYFELPWATHGFDFNLNGPSGQISTRAILHFSKMYLTP